MPATLNGNGRTARPSRFTAHRFEDATPRSDARRLNVREYRASKTSSSKPLDPLLFHFDIAPFDVDYLVLQNCLRLNWTPAAGAPAPPSPPCSCPASSLHRRRLSVAWPAFL